MITACEASERPAPIVPEVVGRLEDGDIREASGLAYSRSQENTLWIINDNGAQEDVHAIDTKGRRLGEFDLKKSRNRDWEDLSSFEKDGTAYLMVADIGDNDARRDFRTLYFVAEPAAEKKGSATLQWRVNFRYPDGPLDAESAAVDLENQRILVLSKRQIPPRLYAVPLHADSDEPVVATSLGTITSLHRPSRNEVATAPKTKDWFWQPVGMDISADNSAAVILTYRAVYYYRRGKDQNWLDALNGSPTRVSLGNFKNAEAIAFGADSQTVFVTGENKHSRLLRIDFSDEERE